ncbi:hypothetical protein GCM10027447_13220 [Glycomyces halotolerans]
MSAEYLLSVDLGTSHTVAVVVWPDGRTRPLLFDGSPVMPSAVFLDEAGTIHTGRDAERLGPTAPERFEPNPKQRIGDGTILLGDREIQVTAAFAAILTTVARACVEAIGGLPRTVLTCPAAWGEQRRAALHDAAAKAGYAPVQIVTEPVAAAHYYTSRLAHPIDSGQALAVFDFGGGTLDIAVVERRGDGSFGVLADGGLPDLGGLDFDAALVAHIGETVRQRDPDLWKRLERPGTATELRDRRTLWNDVRGAKEMLSRSSVAPVAVPGMEQALHLTRGELDQLARPLLSRAVGETTRVVGLTGRSPAQLAGLFLVGGSSRMPLVAKVLHEQLGIAPTVLEQPELPVSEGAALATAGPAPVTPPAMASPPPSPSPGAPVTQASLPPRAPASDGTVPLHMPGRDRAKRRRRNTVIAVIAAVAALAVAAPLAWNHFTDPFRQRPFTNLTAVGEPIGYGTDDLPGDLMAIRVWEERTLFAYSIDTDGDETGDEELHLLAVDNTTGESLWDEKRVLDGNGWLANILVGEELLAVPQAVDSGEYAWYFLDWDDGDLRRTVTRSSNAATRYGSHLVAIGGNDITVYDGAGEVVQDFEVGDAEEGVDIDDWGSVMTSEDLKRPRAGQVGDGRIWALTDDAVVHVFDIESGEEVAANAVESVDDTYFAYDGIVYVTIADSTGYKIRAFDIDQGLRLTAEDLVREEVQPEGLWDCGAGRVCVKQVDADDYATFQVFDIDEGAIVHTFDEYSSGYGSVHPLGERLMVSFYEGDTVVKSQLYDRDFETVGPVHPESFVAVDGGSALDYPTGNEYGLVSGSVVGLGAEDGKRTLVRDTLETYGCSASADFLACHMEDGMQIFTFRER